MSVVHHYLCVFMSENTVAQATVSPGLGLMQSRHQHTVGELIQINEDSTGRYPFLEFPQWLKSVSWNSTKYRRVVKILVCICQV